MNTIVLVNANSRAISGSMVVTKTGTTRRIILEMAMNMASVEGLEGLSIGRLAQRLGMSKSGVIGHFASKEDLQLHTVEAARTRFEQEVLGDIEAEPGIAMLSARINRWIDYVAGDHFSGGCFFWAASAEFDGRPGPVRDRIASLTEAWFHLLRDEVHLAKRLGEIREDIDPTQLAFELHAFVQEANWAWQLLSHRDAFDRARTAVESRLARAANVPAPSD
jgi:AcrR family transcriptional regulator